MEKTKTENLKQLEKEMTTNLKSKLDNLIESFQNIVITTHFRPDHDAMCSALALYWYVTNTTTRSKTRVIIEGSEDNTWDKLKNSQKIEWVENLPKAIENCDLILLIDANSFSRACENPTPLAKHRAKKVCLDHHHTKGTDNFDIKHIDKTAAATTQIIAEKLFSNSLKKLPKKILETLLLGILGDTGKFSYINKTKSRVLGTAQKIIEAGDLIVEEVSLKFGKIQPEELRLTAQLLENTRFAKITGKPNIMYSFLEKEVLSKNQIVVQNAYHNFMSNYLRMVNGYPWGFVVVPVGEKEYKVSLRSINGGPSVLKIAEHFGGGGHIHAAACNIETKNKTPLDVCNMVLSNIVNYIDKGKQNML